MSINLKKLRQAIIILAMASFFSYPLLETIATLIDTRNGVRTTTNGAGFVPYHAISEPAAYLFFYGLTAAVAMSFVYLLVRVWRKRHSKGLTIFIVLLGVIVTPCALMGFLIGIMILGGLIHGNFSL